VEGGGVKGGVSGSSPLGTGGIVQTTVGLLGKYYQLNTTQAVHTVHSITVG